MIHQLDEIHVNEYCDEIRVKEQRGSAWKRSGRRIDTRWERSILEENQATRFAGSGESGEKLSTVVGPSTVLVVQ